MVVTYIFSSHPADQIRVQIRCRNMADAINRTGVHRANELDMASFINNTPHAQRVCCESDLLVLYQYLHGPILAAIQYWKARDKKVIVDFDQAVNYLTKNSPAYSFWFEGSARDGLALGDEDLIDPPPIEQFKWGLAMVDAATVPSLRLADDWSRFTNVHRVLDYINIHHYPALSENHEDEIMVGLGHRVSYESFNKSGLLNAMEKVCDKYPQVKLVLSGMDEIPRTLDINPEQLRMYSPRSFEEWVEILLSLDIGLAPIYGEYDLRLGSYGLLEFMVSRIPWITSEEPELQKLSQYGRRARNSPDTWEKSVTGMLERLEAHRERAAGEPFLFALSQDLSANIDKILNVYSVIINR